MSTLPVPIGQAASDVKRLYDWDDQDLLESLEEADLQQAIDMIEAAIQMKHHSYEARSDLMRPPPSADKPLVRVYVDGCFDMMHSGHFNALRQARKLGDVLVAGVHSDAEITRAKGMPVLNNEERLALVHACKWVDEVVFDTPYNPTVELLDRLNCDFVAHGDDIGPTYAEVMEANRLRVIKRTEGVSTTDIVGRLLLMTKDHHEEQQEDLSPGGILEQLTEWSGCAVVVHRVQLFQEGARFIVSSP
jgi:cytidyltransferase-like protein